MINILHKKTYSMARLIIQLNNEEKAKMLSTFLSELPFVNSVKIIHENHSNDTANNDFFSLAGLWKDRNISQSSIRESAWPDRNQ